MRVHIDLDDALVAEVDEIAGHRQRSAFVRAAIEQRRRWRLIEEAAGSIADTGHAWAADPAA